MGKIVAYCATRNLYPRLATAINSLLVNNADIEKVYCVLEDDVCSTLKDKRIEIINYKSMPRYLSDRSANYNSVFTYMSLVRLCFAKYFNDIDKLLYLDVDTIVDSNIDHVFNADIDGKYVAAVRDAGMIKKNQDYFNSGVLLMNLKQIRKDGIDDKWLEMVNSDKRYTYCDQDVMNITCKGSVCYLPEENNVFCNFRFDGVPKIVHYAGFKKYWDIGTPRNEYYKKYKCESV